jgi:hypothetical protein
MNKLLLPFLIFSLGYIAHDVINAFGINAVQEAQAHGGLDEYDVRRIVEGCSASGYVSMYASLPVTGYVDEWLFSGSADGYIQESLDLDIDC